MIEPSNPLSTNVNLLGQLLGQTIKDHKGETFLAKVETIRQLAKSSRQGNSEDRETLIHTLQTLSDEELLPVARAFSQFLNLVNVAEQFHALSRTTLQKSQHNHLLQTFAKLKEAQIPAAAIEQVINDLNIDLVLTAHPTEVMRRTLIHKNNQLNDCLELLELEGLHPDEQEQLCERIGQLINQAWHTNEIRTRRPTPIDEAKWGLATIENSLWSALPLYMRQLDKSLQKNLGIKLPLHAAPVRFTSWMGGDRDGNPFVTAKVTAEVLTLGRAMATSLFYHDFKLLTAELSMSDCSPELRSRVGETHEPYRVLLRQICNDLHETRDYLQAHTHGHKSDKRDLITQVEQLREPLELCYHSLHSCGMSNIADGMVLDMLRKLSCFGLHLVKLDIRQESTRHSAALGEITRYLGIGDYEQWSEAKRQAFLSQELNSKRPLLPHYFEPTPETKEILMCCKVIAKTPPERLGIYVISMAEAPSDVLAVQLLLKEVGCPFKMPIAPLFETEEDLHQSRAVMARLFSLPEYRDYCDGAQHVMIGYSDSAKDAGMLAAGWAQYTAMEDLVELCDAENIRLTLFHGRGGTVGRGGAPAHKAILSQPPGSLRGGLRVTQQGEMIRFKFGLPKVALQSLLIYTSAVLEGNLLPPPKPKAEWRNVMDILSKSSSQHYRNIVSGTPEFVPYFRAATPEVELGKLPLGSRPAKRNPNGGVESLRAIPWIFAWTQNRLMLPAWLGANAGIASAIEQGKQQLLEEMNREWPFFRTRLDMLEMVFLKTDAWLTEYYESRLVPEALWPLGVKLREELRSSIEMVLTLRVEGELLDDQPWVRESITLRNPYTDPLNLLQAELLARSRRPDAADHPYVDQALMVTIAGIAAGMRNTG